MRTLLAVALAALLALAPAAAGKGLARGQVCGSDGCVELERGRDTVIGGPAVAAPQRRQPFVRLRLRVGDRRHHQLVRMVFLPGRGIMRTTVDGPFENWARAVTPAPYRRAARRVTPFPASALPAHMLAPDPGPWSVVTSW